MFPVGHPFPVVVSQYLIRGKLSLAPLVDPDVPLSSIRLPGFTRRNGSAEQTSGELSVGRAGGRGAAVSKLNLSFSTFRRDVRRPT